MAPRRLTARGRHEGAPAPAFDPSAARWATLERKPRMSKQTQKWLLIGAVGFVAYHFYSQHR